VRLGSGSCTSCICAFGPCHYDHDCPEQATCDTATNRCIAADGTQIPTVFKDECDTWLKTQIDCDKKSVVEERYDKGYDPLGCSDVRILTKGHGSPDVCNPFMNQGKCCVLDGASDVFMCHDGCSVMRDPASAQQIAEQMCKEFSKKLGQDKYKVTWVGNQTYSAAECNSYFYIRCEDGVLTTKYQSCDSLLGSVMCAQPGDKVQCSKDDGWTASAICCPDQPYSRWKLGTSCPVKPCSELAGGVCYGLDPGGNDTIKCTEGGADKTLQCCDQLLAPIQFGIGGSWMNQCVSWCTADQVGICHSSNLFCDGAIGRCNQCPANAMNCDLKGGCECVDGYCDGTKCIPYNSSGGGGSNSGGSCAGSCGYQSPDGCWCDPTCTANGDCCPDHAQLCGSLP